MHENAIYAIIASDLHLKTGNVTLPFWIFRFESKKRSFRQIDLFCQSASCAIATLQHTVQF